MLPFCPKDWRGVLEAFQLRLCHFQHGLEQEPKWGPEGSWRDLFFPKREEAHSSRSQAGFPVGYLKPSQEGA